MADDDVPGECATCNDTETYEEKLPCATCKRSFHHFCVKLQDGFKDPTWRCPQCISKDAEDVNGQHVETDQCVKCQQEAKEGEPLMKCLACEALFHLKCVNAEVDGNHTVLSCPSCQVKQLQVINQEEMVPLSEYKMAVDAFDQAADIIDERDRQKRDLVSERDAFIAEKNELAAENEQLVQRLQALQTRLEVKTRILQTPMPTPEASQPAEVKTAAEQFRDKLKTRQSLLNEAKKLAKEFDDQSSVYSDRSRSQNTVRRYEQSKSEVKPKAPPIERLNKYEFPKSEVKPQVSATINPMEQALLLHCLPDLPKS